MTVSSAEKIIFTTDVPVRWGDMDAYNHVNNVSYFRYLEETRVRWMFKHELSDVDAGLSPVLVKSGATFLKSVLYPATLRITTSLHEIGARSISLQHRILDADNTDICYAEGYAKLVWIDMRTGKSIPLPQRVHDALRQ